MVKKRLVPIYCIRDEVLDMIVKGMIFYRIFYEKSTINHLQQSPLNLVHIGKGRAIHNWSPWIFTHVGRRVKGDLHLFLPP